jgi:hypothetical protein
MLANQALGEKQSDGSMSGLVAKILNAQSIRITIGNKKQYFRKPSLSQFFLFFFKALAFPFQNFPTN